MSRPFLLRRGHRASFYFPMLWSRYIGTRGLYGDRGIQLSRARLMGVALLLLVPGVLLAAWLFSLLEWIR